MEAELKVGTVKALKVGMKILSNFADVPKKPGNLESHSIKTFIDNLQGAVKPTGKGGPRGLGGPPGLGGPRGPGGLGAPGPYGNPKMMGLHRMPFQRFDNPMNFQPRGPPPQINRPYSLMNSGRPIAFDSAQIPPPSGSNWA